jgi:iron complex transport system substrate-binding protein
MKRLAAFAATMVALASAAFADPAARRDVVDMAGRRVSIPISIKKVYSSSPPATYLMYAVAPDLLAGLNFPFRENEKRLLRPEVVRLPVIGGTFGQGRRMNPEAVLAVHPDFVLAWLDRTRDASKIEAEFARTGLPVVFIRLDTLSDYPATLKFLGDLFGRPGRAAEMAGYIDQALKRVSAAVASIPPDRRIRVYYAEGVNGLATECDRSFHVEPVLLAGGDNVHHCEQGSHYGMEKVSLEQIVAYRPSLILAQERRFAEAAASPGWRNVEAVKHGRVVYVPRSPFNWIDRPPSFMRALGVQWLANLFYPDRYPLDLGDETRKFYRLFLGVELTAADLDRILN